jgi:2-polyprenyl-3-methyl-5-hydroxy-6-metoxy-1,4-benzoquinol methylase
MKHNDFMSFIEQQQSSKEAFLHLLDYASMFRLKLIQEFVGDVNEKEILDIGCGNGSVSFLMWYLGAKVCSVDVSKQALQSTRSLRCLSEHSAQFQPNLCQGDATRLPLREEMFDIVFCIETLEHLQDDTGAIKEIERVTKSGGTVILAVPYDSRVTGNGESLGTYRRYSFKTLKELLFSRRLCLKRTVFWCFPLLKVLDLLMMRTFFATLGFLINPSGRQHKNGGGFASSLKSFYMTRFWRIGALPLMMSILNFDMLFQHLPYSNDVFLILTKT